MERIVIEVEDDTAKKWRFSSQKTKNKVSQEINLKLATELEANSTQEFREYLDELGKTMQERGLTEEILNDILKDED